MTLQELLFFRAKAELDVYTAMTSQKVYYTPNDIDRQSERVSSTYQVIEEAGLVEEYERYKEITEAIDGGKKYLGKFPLQKLFTPYIHYLMCDGSEIMLFPDNGQILVDEEIDKWNKENGLSDPTKRVLYHNHNGKFYSVKYTDYGSDLTIPYTAINREYLAFLKDIQEDLAEEMTQQEYVLSYAIDGRVDVRVAATDIQDAKEKGDCMIGDLDFGEVECITWKAVNIEDSKGNLHDF